MKKNPDQPADAAALRRLAEERWKAREEIPRSDTPRSDERLVHELQVHQIELEMQNEELQQARARADALLVQYTDLYDFAPISYFTLDREGTIRQVNLTGARLLGVERSRLVNRRFGQFVAEGDRRAFSDFLEKVFASEAMESCQLTLPREGPQPLVVRIEGIRSVDGQKCRVVMLDITKRRRAEEALREKSEEQTWLLKSMLNAFVLFDSVFDVNGKFVSYRFRYINNAYERITGVTQEEVFGKTVHEIWPETEASWIENYGSVAMSGKPLTFDMYHKPTAKHYHCFVYRPQDTNRQFCVVFEDITERQKAETAIRQQLDELQRWHEATLGRERRIQELKREINHLLVAAGQAPRFASVAGDGEK